MDQAKETYEFTRAKILADCKRKLKRRFTYLVLGGIAGFIGGWWFFPDVVPARMFIFLGGLLMGLVKAFQEESDR